MFLRVAADCTICKTIFTGRRQGGVLGLVTQAQDTSSPHTATASTTQANTNSVIFVSFLTQVSDLIRLVGFYMDWVCR